MACVVDPRAGLIADVLGRTDCLIADKVQSGYAALLAPGGQMMSVLTGVLVIYVAFTGYRLVIGRATLSLDELVPHFIKIGVVLALATRWPAFQTLVFNLLFDGPQQLANLILGVSGTGSADVLAALQALFDRLTAAAADAWAVSPAADPALPGNVPADPTVVPPPVVPEVPGAGTAAVPGALPAANAATTLPTAGLAIGPPLFIAMALWITALVMLASTIGLLLVARILLALLLLVGPVFIIMALFSGTRGLFEGWLRTAIRFALVPLFALLAAAGMVAALTPFVVAMADEPVVSLTEGPVLPMLMIVMVFAVVLLQSTRLTAGIVDGLRLPESWKAGRDAPAALAAAAAAENRITAAPGAMATGASAGGMTIMQGGSFGGAAGGMTPAGIDPLRRAAITATDPVAVDVGARLGHGYRRTSVMRATQGRSR